MSLVGGLVDVVLDFERPIVELAKRIAQLRELQQAEGGTNLGESIEQLEKQANKLQERIFLRLTPWQRTQLARHPNRPTMLDYIDALFDEWTELHGDRAGFDDSAMVCGICRFDGRAVVALGHHKGGNTKQNICRNFGMARPEGYRKALRVMNLANRFRLPVITFIDTPGAYPGVDAEARGQAEAIARNIMEMSSLEVPVISIVTGEGGSGGALAIGVANRVLMLENAIYSVISPEGCAAILWRDRAEGPRAAEALKITARDCLDLDVADEVIEEPIGGAHRDHREVLRAVKSAIERHLQQLSLLDAHQLRCQRYDRFRALGKVANDE